ncbi:DUF916 and DUF3324 domain-containing protein [Enterococcus sp. LJL99]
MKKKGYLLLLFSLYIVAFFGFSVNANAQQNFTYEVVKPENQQGDVSYFNLRMTPGQKQTVEIRVTNSESEEQTIDVEINGAKTNSNGVIDYGGLAIKNDDSLKYDFKEIVKGPNEITLAPNETKSLLLEIDMPEVSYDGKIIGGITMKSKPTKKEEEENKKAKGVISQYAFLVGMVLQETDTPVEVNLKLNKVYAGLANYRNSIFADFSNVTSEIVEGMSVEMEVSKKGSSAILYDTKRTDMRMAPNSLIEFPLEMNGDKMETGDYKAHILVTAKDNKKWEWNQDFKITKEEADKYNTQDVGLVQERGINWKIIAGIVLGVIVLFLFVFFIVRKMNRTKKNKIKQVKKSKKKKMNKTNK